jgi:RNA binding exosome subunit
LKLLPHIVRVFLNRYVKSAAIIKESEDGEPVMGPVKTYGITITDSNFIKENGMYGENLIAAVVVNTERKDKAIEFMKLLK